VDEKSKSENKKVINQKVYMKFVEQKKKWVVKKSKVKLVIVVEEKIYED
jgi:hypothetical protein